MKNLQFYLLLSIMTMASACTQSLHITEGSCHKIGNHQHAFAPIKGSSSVIYNNNSA